MNAQVSLTSPDLQWLTVENPDCPAMPMTLTHCPICECTLEVIRLPPDTSLWGRYWCDACAMPRGFAAWPLDQAASWRLPIGRYRGWALGEVDREPRGRSYLRWVARNFSQVGEMVDAYLSQIRESIAQNSEVPGTFSTVHECI